MENITEYKYNKYKTLYHQSKWTGVPERKYYIKAKKYKNMLVQSSNYQFGGAQNQHNTNSSKSSLSSDTDESDTDESDTDESDTDESDTDESDTDESDTDESLTSDSTSSSIESDSSSPDHSDHIILQDVEEGRIETLSEENYQHFLTQLQSKLPNQDDFSEFSRFNYLISNIIPNSNLVILFGISHSLPFGNFSDFLTIKYFFV